MSDRSIESDDGNGINVFSLFRSGNRYGQMDDNDDIMSHSPPNHDFPEPIKFHPRRSKFHTLNEDPAGESKGAGDISSLLPSIEGKFKNIIVTKPLHSNSGESSQQAVFPVYRRGSVADALSRTGGADGETAAPFTALKLYERSKQVSTTVAEPGPIPRMARRASDTNLLQAFAGPLRKKAQGDRAVSKVISNAVESKEPAPVETPKVAKAPFEVKPMEIYKDVTDTPGPMSTFSGWLFGGQAAKKVEVTNKDLNVFSPTSF